jgi:hypothetical protein
MKEIGPEHPLSYRKEVLDSLFRYVRSSDSFFVIGGASSGKTRLMDHISRQDVQQHYLGDSFQTTWLIRVDLNRHHDTDDWNFYELLLSSMMLSCRQHDDISGIFEQLVDLDRRVMESKDYLQALRFFELAVYRLCKINNINLCFLLDEFDEMYRTMPKEILAQLRAVRDANKYQVCYGLFLRDLPERLRETSDNENFYELLSHRMIGLGPLSYDDAIRAIQQMEERREISLSLKWRDAFVTASGGHPGLLQALLSIYTNTTKENESIRDLKWLVKQEFIAEECEKIWDSLSEEEQVWLLEAVRGHFDLIPPKVLKLLTAKGILQKKGDGYEVFSPIFDRYLKEK